MSPDFENAKQEAASKTDVTIGDRITGWTSNLIATALVIIIALVGGRQLVSSFQPESALAVQASQPTLVEAWPELEFCSLQFGDSTVTIDYSKFDGDREKAYQYLQSKCAVVLQKGSGAGVSTLADPIEAIGPNESQMLEQCKDLTPSIAEPGQWRIFRVGDFGAEKNLAKRIAGIGSKSNRALSAQSFKGMGLPMVIGIRDDCPGTTPSRLITWGMALPMATKPMVPTADSNSMTKENVAEEKAAPLAPTTWKAYVSSSIESRLPADTSTEFIPPGAERTVAIQSPESVSIIGFSGGNCDDVIAFFNHLQIEKSWETSKPWSRAGDTWSVGFHVPRLNGPAYRSVRVQLQTQPGQELRGILLLEPASGELAKK